MSDPLWKLDAFVEATGGSIKGDAGANITGISIDSRSLEPGDAFIAIKGDRLDGHDYVAVALEAGASLALVAESRLADLPEDGRYVVVSDPLEAMRRLGIAARARTRARIVAVTGIRWKNRNQGGAAADVGAVRQGACIGRLVQQSLGRAPDACPHAG